MLQQVRGLWWRNRQVAAARSWEAKAARRVEDALNGHVEINPAKT
jgi:hypothetical protein